MYICVGFQIFFDRVFILFSIKGLIVAVVGTMQRQTEIF